jgi:hypothetical protein
MAWQRGAFVADGGLNKSDGKGGAKPIAKPLAKAGPAWVGRCALGVAACAAAVLAWQGTKLLRTALLPSPTAFVQSDAAGADRFKARGESLDEAVARLDGRSLFYVPSKPGEVVALPAEATEEEPEEVAPDKYEGPAITAIVLDEVWLGGSKRAKAGGEAVDGVKVLSTNAPWGAKVEWRGKEYEVSFFERDRVVWKDGK